MNNNTILVLGGLVGFLLGVIQSFPNIKRIVQIHRTASFSLDASSEENVREITGRAASGSYNIHSPLTQTPCVFWHAQIQEQRSSGENSYWETIFDETSIHPFNITDVENGTGTYTIYPSNAELLLRVDTFQGSEENVSLEPKIMKAIKQLPISPFGPLGLTKPLRMSEQMIKTDEMIYILGKLVDKGGVRVISSPQDGSPFLISDRSQHAVLAMLYWRVLVSAFLLACLGVFLAYFVIHQQ